MKLISIHIFKWHEEKPIMLCNAMELSMLRFYQKGQAKDTLNYNSRMICSKIPPGNKAAVVIEEGISVCYCYTGKDGLAVTCVTDGEYPERAAFLLLAKIMMDFREKYEEGS
jgi:hypothetical protein